MTAPLGAGSFFSRRWVQNTLLVLATAAAAYGMIFVDVMARAREAFRQGDVYWRWHDDPENKRQSLEKNFLKQKDSLERQKAKGKITEQEFAEKLDILAFDRDQAMAESSVKYAYQWYKDTYELFSPPESRWVKRARYLAPAAKQKWREELAAKNIPFEEYMLDLEAGEDAETLMVASTQSPELARQAVDILRSREIEAKLYDAKARGRLAQEGIKIIVPRAAFWEAHDALKDLFAGPAQN